jgi:DNA topoisomerase VI subunit A
MAGSPAGVRRLLYRMHSGEAPAHCLLDNDPGYYIYSVLTRSINLG